jgi:hypothetical protein
MTVEVRLRTTPCRGEAPVGHGFSGRFVQPGKPLLCWMSTASACPAAETSTRSNTLPSSPLRLAAGG